MNTDIKKQLQQFFDEDIWSISKDGNLYYVRLDEEDEIIYETDINGNNITPVGIPLPMLENMELIYSKFI